MFKECSGGSVGMRMDEECSPKRGMETGMDNILNGRAKSGKISSSQSPLR
jgi:chloramphenicol 3-O-phosphotransferase